jgi:branched-chain amino acid transport system substrate-binding protein
MRVCCTRPRKSNESPHWNDVPDELIHANYQEQSVRQKLNDWRCQTCGMPLFLDDARYVVLGQIGQGGFGRTFRALDRRLFLQERMVKQLRSERFLTELQMHEALRSFGNEAMVLADLNHPQIPRLFPPFTLSDGQPDQPSFFYLPQNYIDGCNLQELLEQRHPRTFEESEIRVLLRKMLDILHYVHEKQLIHRDLKPSNILFAKDDYHLIDFGAVKLQQNIGETEGTDLSMTATRICTPGYSPQEQYRGRAYASSDLYSLAATCVCLLTAKHPNDLDIPNDLESWQAIAKVTPSLAAILNKMLEMKCGDRYQSAQEVIEALSMTEQPILPLALPLEPETQPPSEPDSKPLRWLKPRLVAVGAVLGIAIAALWAIAQIPSIQCRLSNSCASEPSKVLSPPLSKPDDLAAIALPSIASVANVPTGKIRYGGSTAWAELRGAALPFIKQAFPNFQLEYQDPPNSRPYSEAGIAMLINGQLDIALSSKGISSDLRKQAEQKGIKLKEIPVAINANAIAVHPSLNIPGLTIEQLNSIKSGRITNWKEVGGPDLKIQVYASDERYLSGAKFVRVSNATDGIRKVSQDPGGFLRASAALVVPQCGVKALPLGLNADKLVAPYQLPLIPVEQCSEQNHNQVDVNTFRTGEYSDVEMLSVVIVEDGGAKQQAGEAYANMLLTAEGQQVVNKSGYLAYSLEQHISNGDRLLIENVTSPDKMAGVEAIRNQDYRAAVDALTRSLSQNKNDPETLIYLNNAKLWAEKRQTYRIALSVPIGTKENIAQEILRGAAQAQNEINQSGMVSGVGLEVVIVDDRNDPAIARQIAEKLTKDKSVLAVVGHNTSDVSKAAAEVYQANGLVLVSPTTFNAEVAKIGNYIFRAVPTAQTMSNVLVDYIKAKSPAKVLICYDSEAPDQGTFRSAFIDSLTSRGGQELVLVDAQGQDQCNYSSGSFDANTVVQKAIAQGANAIFVGSNVNNFQPTVDLIKANNQKLLLFGNATLYTEEVITQAKQSAEGLVLVTPWTPDAHPSFAEQAKALWGASVNWRTATSYDATRAVIAGLVKSNTRDGLQQVLQARDFTTTGSGDMVRFLESRDRILTPALVEVKKGRFEAISK